MARILVINGHPDPSPDRLAAAMSRSYGEAAQKSGHDVHHIAVGALDFPLLHDPRDFLSEPDNSAIIAARGQILLARHLVFIYPLWLGGPPALLKAFLEQVSRAQFALGAGKGFPAGKLKGRSARVMVSMGMPAPIYRTFFGAHGVKAMNSAILTLAGVRPVRTSYFGMIGEPGRGEKAVRAAAALGRAGA